MVQKLYPRREQLSFFPPVLFSLLRAEPLPSLLNVPLVVMPEPGKSNRDIRQKISRFLLVKNNFHFTTALGFTEAATVDCNEVLLVKKLV